MPVAILPVGRSSTAVDEGYRSEASPDHNTSAVTSESSESQSIAQEGLGAPESPSFGPTGRLTDFEEVDAAARLLAAQFGPRTTSFHRQPHHENYQASYTSSFQAQESSSMLASTGNYSASAVVKEEVFEYHADGHHNSAPPFPLPQGPNFMHVDIGGLSRTLPLPFRTSGNAKPVHNSTPLAGTEWERYLQNQEELRRVWNHRPWYGLSQEHSNAQVSLEQPEEG
jgi:hypothetical protein